MSLPKHPLEDYMNIQSVELEDPPDALLKDKSTSSRPPAPPSLDPLFLRDIHFQDVQHGFTIEGGSLTPVSYPSR
jgi:hypothetical protein